MSEAERFAEFLAHAAARYHAPPEAPRRSMWRAIEASLRSAAEETAPVVGSDADIVAASERYHAPPITPHDEMWSRIEPAWEMRRAAPERARDAGLEELPTPPVDRDSGSGRRRFGRWVTGIGIAASLAIGIAIGRGTVGPSATDSVASGDSPEIPSAGSIGPAGQPASDPVAPEGDRFAVGPLEAAGSADEGSQAAAPRAVGLASSSSPVTGPDSSSPVAGLAAADGRVRSPASDVDPSSAAPTRWNVAVRLATAKHLGQAETLLTSFRADPAVAEDQAVPISGWARDLLGETRLLLDLPAERSPAERALLEELELVLAQIAGLRPDTPGFERDLIAEGLVREGTIARLRAAAPPGTGAAIGT